MEMLSAKAIVAIGGAIVGLIFGFIVERTNFCTMGAISDATAFGDFKRVRAWVLAVAVAVAGTQALQLAGLVDLQKSIYLGTSIGWLGAIIGGLLFGFGMTLAGGCASRNLVRFGAGDLRALVVLIVLGIFAYMTLRGLTAPPRVALENVTNLNVATQGMPDLLAQGVGASVAGVRGVATLVTVLALLWYCFKDAEFRGSPMHIFSGVGVGAAIIAGWYVTGVLGADEFEPTRPASLTYTAPVGNALVYLMTFTGSSIDFGIASVGGAIVGAYVSALLRKSFAVLAFADRGDLVRSLTGAAMMGVGGVMALGCTIGQGLTGIATLSLGSLISLVALVVGGIAGIKYLESRLA